MKHLNLTKAESIVLVVSLSMLIGGTVFIYASQPGTLSTLHEQEEPWSSFGGTARLVKRGMSEADLVKALGNPDVTTYAAQDDQTRQPAKEVRSSELTYYDEESGIALKIMLESDKVIGMTKTNWPLSKRGPDAYTAIPSDEVSWGGPVVEYAWDATNPYYGFDAYGDVVMVRINSIDGGRNVNPFADENVSPQTFGKMTVLETYKGHLSPGEELRYYRSGGIISQQQYLDAMSERDKASFLQRNLIDTLPKYFGAKAMDDIEVVVGKRYLVFLLPQGGRGNGANFTEEYGIAAGEHGLREVRGRGEKIEVLNNITQEWQALSSVVRLGAA